MTTQEALRTAGLMYLEGQLDAAEQLMLEQYAQGSTHPHVLLNLALLRSLRADFDGCTTYCEMSLARAPHFREAEDLLAFQRLRDGRWEEGFKLAEARFGKPVAIPYLDFPMPEWDGNRHARRLLIWGEQGLGDTVQFGRLLGAVVERGHDVTFLVQDGLEELFRDSHLVNRVYRISDVARFERVEGRNNAFSVDLEFLRAHQFDSHLPVMSLARVLGINSNLIPGRCPYLRPSDFRMLDIRRRLREINQFRVGLVWAGRPSLHPEFERTNRRRNIPLSSLEPLLALPGIRFFSLQKGPDELEAIPFQVIERIALTDCYADTAAVLGELDLLITVDTSIAHVAGGLGVPVWLLNRADTCWRWGRTGSRTDWYPSMRIFRQPTPGDWGAVVREVSDTLFARVTDFRPALLRC